MAERAEIDGLDLIGSVMDLVKALMSAALKADGERLLLMEAHILRVVLANGGCTQLDVVRETRRDKAQVGKLVRGLVDRGLLVRAPDAEDARRQWLALTAAGEAVARRAMAHRAAIARQLFEGMPTSELDNLLTSLRRLNAALDE